jgi:hypothetical protein
MEAKKVGTCNDGACKDMRDLPVLGEDRRLGSSRYSWQSGMQDFFVEVDEFLVWQILDVVSTWLMMILCDMLRGTC